MIKRAWPESIRYQNENQFYCSCDVPQLSFREYATGAFVCRCGRMIPCEKCLSSGDGYRLAEYEQLDGFVCCRHAENVELLPSWKMGGMP